MSNTTKPSGIPWLGEVPAHWKVKRLAYLGEFWKGRGIARADITDEGVPAILYGDIYTQYDHKAVSLVKCTTPEVAAGSEEIRRGDLLLTGSGETKEDIGKCVVYLGDGKAYAGGDVIIFRQKEADSEFLSYILNSAFVVSQKTQMAKGEIVVHIYSSDLRDIVFPLPPLPEQRAIAAFLDERTARIDGLLARKQRLVQLLKEKRQALITRAVTRGLDAKVKLKQSGVPWLGEVPEHWGVLPIRRRAIRVQTGNTPPTAQEEYYEEGSIPWYGPSSFTDALDAGIPVKFIHQRAITDGVARMFDADSVLLVGIGATLGKVAYLPLAASTNQQVTAITFDPRLISGKYMAYQLKLSEQVFKGIAPSATLAILDQQEISSFHVVVPPLEEQEIIVQHLDAHLNRFDALITKVDQAVLRLQEYRTALISAAVTGKVRVLIGRSEDRKIRQ